MSKRCSGSCVKAIAPRYGNGRGCSLATRCQSFAIMRRDICWNKVNSCVVTVIRLSWLTKRPPKSRGGRSTASTLSSALRKCEAGTRYANAPRKAFRVVSPLPAPDELMAYRCANGVRYRCCPAFAVSPTNSVSTNAFLNNTSEFSDFSGRLL